MFTSARFFARKLSWLGGFAFAASIGLGSPATMFAQAVSEPKSKAETSSETKAATDGKPTTAEKSPREVPPVDPTAGANPADRIKQLLGDINDNMKQIEKLLDQNDTGSGTTALQSKAVEKLDELIEVMGKT
ncbi:MAG: hypothetical protein ACKVX7_14720 [Planctomycetota bacterium]